MLDNEQLGSESAQAGSPVAVEGQEAGDMNNESEGVGAETGGEGSSGAAWVGAASAPLKRPIRLEVGYGLPYPLPSSPKTLRSRAAKVTVVAGSRQARVSARRSTQVLNRI